VDEDGDWVVCEVAVVLLWVAFVDVDGVGGGAAAFWVVWGFLEVGLEVL